MSSLLPTPREDPLDFPQEQSEVQKPQNSQVEMVKKTDNDVSIPPSPPTSPAKNKSLSDATDENYADPPLYSSVQQNSSDEETSLFPDTDDVDEIIEKHVEATRVNSTIATGTSQPALSRPTNEEYRLTASFVSILHKQDARQLFRETMAENAKYYHLAVHPGGRIIKRKKVVPNTTSIQKPTPRQKSDTKGRKNSINRVIRPAPSNRATTPAGASVPVPKTRAPATKKSDDKTAREFWTIVDYSPNTYHYFGHRDDAFSNLKWTGNRLDLSKDPHVAELHPSERKAAEALRLEGDRWLTTKRQIFKSAVECYLKGKDFKKTDAQKATMIDVNKASKIWEAFNSVGWFNAQYLARMAEQMQRQPSTT